MPLMFDAATRRHMPPRRHFRHDACAFRGCCRLRATLRRRLLPDFQMLFFATLLPLRRLRFRQMNTNRRDVSFVYCFNITLIAFLYCDAADVISILLLLYGFFIRAAAAATLR